MILTWLDEIEAAADRGSRCTSGVSSAECPCDVCSYRLAGHTLDKESSR